MIIGRRQRLLHSAYDLASIGLDLGWQNLSSGMSRGRGAVDHSALQVFVKQLRRVVVALQNYQVPSMVGRYPRHYDDSVS